MYCAHERQRAIERMSVCWMCSGECTHFPAQLGTSEIYPTSSCNNRQQHCFRWEIRRDFADLESTSRKLHFPSFLSPLAQLLWPYDPSYIISVHFSSSLSSCSSTSADARSWRCCGHSIQTPWKLQAHAHNSPSDIIKHSSIRSAMTLLLLLFFFFHSIYSSVLATRVIQYVIDRSLHVMFK